MKYIITLISVVVCGLTAAADWMVTGRVINSAGEPQEYATYRIFTVADTLHPMAYGTADAQGLFKANLSQSGAYKVKASVVGLAEGVKEFTLTAENRSMNIGDIVCGDASRLLGEVTVTAAKPLVTREIDRIGYDVQADIESKTTTLQETLRKVPLVSVDPDGTIKVKGSTDFKIYKNGKPNNSFTKNAKEIFRAIPASMIKKIEVITDPGAREDAEGVGEILNIVTEQSASIKGVMANVGLDYNSKIGLPAPNLWGSAQIDKVTLSAYAGMNFITRRGSESTTLTDGLYEETGNRSYYESLGSSRGNVNWWGIDGSYELDSLNLFTLEFGGYSYDVDARSEGYRSLTDAAGNMIYSYAERSKTSPTRYLDFNGNFNYQRSTRRKGENITLSYMISTTNQRNNQHTEYDDMFNMPVDYTGIISDFNLKFTEHTFQANWTRPLSGLQTLDLGAKYIFRHNHSNTHQEYFGTDRSPITDFTHNTSVAAAFADYRVKIKKLSLRAGLRYEFSRLSAKYADGSYPSFASNLSDWVPNLAASYSFNQSHTLKASYSTRINRPGITYLNPAVSETPSTTSQGNPNLSSALYHQLNLNYSMISRKVNIDFNTGYSFTNDAIIDVQRVEDDHTYSTYYNAGRNRTVSASLFMQWMMSAKTTLMINGGTNYNHYANPSLDIARGGWSGYGFMRLTQKLPWKITGSIDLSGWLGNVSLYSEMRPVGISAIDYRIAFTRNFLKEDRLTVRLTLSDPLYRHRDEYRTESYNTMYKTVSRMLSKPNRGISIGVSYRFGSMSAQVKKTLKSISNDDLVGRKTGD